MFQYLVTRVELKEAEIAKLAAKRATAIRKKYAGRKGEYLSILFGLAYYVLSVVFTPVASAALIFLFLFVRYVIPVIFYLFCFVSIASITYYVGQSNLLWVGENINSLFLLRFRPLLSPEAVFFLHVLLPVIFVAVVFISLAAAISIQYKNAIFQNEDK